MRRIRHARGWDLFALPRRAQALIVCTELLWAAALVWSLTVTPLRLADLGMFAVFTACGLASIETALRVSWPYRSSKAVSNLLGIWALPIIVLLPPFYAAITMLPLAVFTTVRVVRHPPVKVVFNIASQGLAGFAASVGFHLWTGTMTHSRVSVTSLGDFLLAGASDAVYVVVNVLLVGGVLFLVQHTGSVREVARSASNLHLAGIELCMGLLVTVAWSVHPFLVLVALPPVLLLQRSLFVAELRKAATTDAKTGTANIAHWKDVTEREIARSRNSGSLVVLLIDVDHFKAVNDQHGHLMGDEVLVAVADALTTGLRPRDLVGRFGGEEFAVLLAESDVFDGRGAAERIRHAVATKVTAGIQVTVSIGVAALGINGHSLHELLDAADTALYAAKASGRNCVRVADRATQQVFDLTGADRVIDLTDESAAVRQSAVIEPVADTIF